MVLLPLSSTVLGLQADMMPYPIHCIDTVYLSWSFMLEQPVLLPAIPSHHLHYDINMHVYFVPFFPITSLYHSSLLFVMQSFFPIIPHSILMFHVKLSSWCPSLIASFNYFFPYIMAPSTFLALFHTCYNIDDKYFIMESYDPHISPWWGPGKWQSYLCLKNQLQARPII